MSYGNGTARNVASIGISRPLKNEDSPQVLNETESKDMTSTFGHSLDLAQFAFSPSLHSGMEMSPTILRRSPRKPIPKLKEEESDSLPDFSEAEVKPRKRSTAMMLGGQSPKKSPKKPKRTYAAPETYAHLTGLQDWLKEELDGRPYFVDTRQSNINADMC